MTRGKAHSPPIWPQRLLHRLCKPALADEILGDLEEHFHLRLAEMPPWQARLLFCKDALLFLRPYTFGPAHTRQPLIASYAMWKNYLKTAVRQMRRQKVYAGINVLGLGVGIACGLLATLFVLDELSYDTFHAEGDRVYRLGTDLSVPDGRVSRFNANAWPVGILAREDVPGIESVVHLRRHPDKVDLSGEYRFEDIYYAEEGFLDLFSFPLVFGNPEGALVAPYTAVITTEAAARLFGRENVVGQTLTLRDSVDHTITGVVDLGTRRSHVQFDILASFASWDEERTTAYEERWLDLNMYHYAKLTEDADPEAVRARAAGLYDRHAGDRLSGVGYAATVRMEALGDLYLRSDRGNLFGPSGDIRYVYLIAGIGVIMLLVAGINFINLSTARSLERAREVGMRKVVGSSRGLIVQQFLAEAGATGLLALLVGLAMAALAMPYFNTLTQRELALAQLLTPSFLAVGTVIGLTVSLAAGFYPALVMARHQPAQVLKGSGSGVAGGARLRRMLVVAQYGISCILILTALTGYQQIRFMQSADVGFEREQVLVVEAQRLGSERLNAARQTLRDRLATQAGIQSLTQTAAVPGRRGWPSIMVFPEGRSQDDGLTIEFIAVDHAYVGTFGLELIAGRDFDPNRPGDEGETIILNEAAVQAMGFGSPAQAIGKRVEAPNRNAQGAVIGVVKNYNHHGLQQEIRPIVYGISPYPRYLAVRGQTAEMASLVATVGETWRTLFPGYDFTYFFLDEGYDEQYRNEARLTQVFVTFAILSILVSCLGLFGLSAFTISKRTREIGVRKVLGASSGLIVRTVSWEFLLLVGMSFLIAAPVSWYLVEEWLAGFAYRTTVGPGVFLATAGLAMGIAMATVGYHAFRASRIDPARALRQQ